MSCSSTRNHEVVSRVCDESYMYGVRMVGSTDAKDQLVLVAEAAWRIGDWSGTAAGRPQATPIVPSATPFVVEH